MMSRIFGFLLIAGAAFLVWLSSKEHPKLVRTGPPTLGELVSEDLKSTQKKGQLPIIWNSIKLVTTHFSSESQKELMKDQNFEIPRNLNGEYELEIDFIDIPDEKTPGLILQFSLIEVKSKNKKWEMGKTYFFSDFKK